ncbi:HAAS signaling domain-containing protein [Jutongia sp.]
MTKYEFLGDLSRLLKDLPEEERKQALHYYEDYFADAGEDNEQEVLNELGSPENIAELIKADSPDEITYGDGASTHATAPLQPYKAAGQEHSETISGNASYGTPDSTQNDHAQSDDNWHNMSGNTFGDTKDAAYNSGSNNSWHNMSGDSSGNQQSDTGYTNGGTSQNNASGAKQSAGNRSSGLFSGMDNTNLIIMIIVLVVTSPIWGSVLLGIASFLLGVLGALVGIFAALIFGGGGSAIGGIVAIAAGFIALLAGHAASGVLTIGVGCLLFSLGSAFCYLGVFLAIRLIPLLWRQLGRLWDWCRIKLSGKEASC